MLPTTLLVGEAYYVNGLTGICEEKVKGGHYNLFRSTIEMLAEWCQSVGMPQPRYDYQLGKDNKHRAVITLANGQVFSGCYTQNVDQAAELTAGIALTQLVSDSNEPFPNHVVLLVPVMMLLLLLLLSCFCFIIVAFTLF